MRSPYRDLFVAVIPDSIGGRIYFKIFEIFVACFTLDLAWEWALYIPRLTDVVLPLGLAIYLDLNFVMNPAVATGLAILTTIGVLVGFIRLPLVGRFGYAVAFVTILVLYAARFSQGEIPHSANLFGMATLAVALGVLCFTERLKRARFVFGFTYFYLGVAYTLAGISKLIGTGLHWSDGRHLWMWINEKSIDSFSKFGELDLNWLQSLALEHRWIATALLTFGWISELSAFLVWWEKFRRPVLILILMLHFGIWMSMNIMFKLSVIELFILLLPIPMVVDRYAGNSSLLRKIDWFATKTG